MMSKAVSLASLALLLLCLTSSINSQSTTSNSSLSNSTVIDSSDDNITIANKTKQTRMSAKYPTDLLTYDQI